MVTRNMSYAEYPHIFGTTEKKRHDNLPRALCTLDLRRLNPILEHYAFRNLIVS
jgi:hypothetical protein